VARADRATGEASLAAAIQKNSGRPQGLVAPLGGKLEMRQSACEGGRLLVL